MDIVGFLPARDEERNLPKVLNSMNSQTVPFTTIIVVNDASIDKTGDIAEDFGAIVIHQKNRHLNYLGYPWLAKIYNYALDYIDRKNIHYDYLVQHGADIVLSPEYNERIIDLMEKNKKLVISSGEIIGEPVINTHARGVGRFIKGWFWKRHVRKFPIIYSWESYPIYKAFSLGYRVTNFPELKMKGLRPTSQLQHNYGYAMRELGYFPFYAILYCLYTFLKNKQSGAKMLATYVTSPYKLHDKNIKRWLRFYQSKFISEMLVNPKKTKIIIERLTI